MNTITLLIERPLPHVVAECLNKADALPICWVCSFDFKKTRELFNLPDNIKIAALMPIGYASAQGVPSDRHQKRKPIEETVHYL